MFAVLNRTYHSNDGCGQITQDWNLTDPFNTTIFGIQSPYYGGQAKTGCAVAVWIISLLARLYSNYLLMWKKQQEKTRLIPDSWHVHVFFRRWLAATANLAATPDRLNYLLLLCYLFAAVPYTQNTPNKLCLAPMALNRSAEFWHNCQRWCILQPVCQQFVFSFLSLNGKYIYLRSFPPTLLFLIAV